MITNVRKLKLFPRLSRVVGGRRAKKLLVSVLESKQSYGFNDTDYFTGAFVWGETKEGHRFWSKLVSKVSRRVKRCHGL